VQTFHPSTRFWLYCAGLASLAFALIAALYSLEGPFQRFDFWLGNSLHIIVDRISYRLLDLMAVISLIGGQGTALIGVLIFGYLLVRRSWAELLLWSFALGSTLIFNRLLKDVFEMMRPVVGHMEILEVSNGFPSGHAMMSIVTYGLIAYFISQRQHLRSFHLAGWVSAGLIIFIIGFSRLYLTVHYLSDVLGGWAAGVAWMCLCIWLYQTILARREATTSSVDATGRLVPNQD
jgi:membrane-associated phospholipid phosphatase